jgi:DNA-binding response OmpR family regulator
LLDEERQALQAGAVHFLQKPVNKDVLLPAIRNAIKSPPLGGKKAMNRCQLSGTLFFRNWVRLFESFYFAEPTRKRVTR